MPYNRGVSFNLDIPPKYRERAEFHPAPPAPSPDPRYHHSEYTIYYSLWPVFSTVLAVAGLDRRRVFNCRVSHWRARTELRLHASAAPREELLVIQAGDWAPGLVGYQVTDCLTGQWVGTVVYAVNFMPGQASWELYYPDASLPAILDGTVPGCARGLGRALSFAAPSYVLHDVQERLLGDLRPVWSWATVLRLRLYDAPPGAAVDRRLVLGAALLAAKDYGDSGA